MADQREYHIEPIEQLGQYLNVAVTVGMLEAQGWHDPVVQCIEDSRGRIFSVLVVSRVQKEPKYG